MIDKQTVEPCSDAISRRMAIDALHGHFDGMLETDTWSPCDIYGLIEILPSVQPEPKWISCKEKMPEEDLWTGASQQYSYGVLMCVLNFDDGEEMIDFGHTIDGKWYSDTAGAYVENSSNWKVVAWMLPPSYKENE